MGIESKLYDECLKCKYASIVRKMGTGKIVKIICTINESDCNIPVSWKYTENSLSRTNDQCPTYAERYLYNIYKTDKK